MIAMRCKYSSDMPVMEHTIEHITICKLERCERYTTCSNLVIFGPRNYKRCHSFTDVHMSRFSYLNK